MLTLDTNNKLYDLMIRGREKRRSNIYKYHLVKRGGKRELPREIHRVGPEFVKVLEFREVVLEFREIRRGEFW